ncbi:MAG: Abortive infection protein [Deltaproteobacteria bacterium]|nr:Abortive infection protein [Deltaproteobacteria bacterium]
MTSPDPRTASLYHAASRAAFSAFGASSIVFASVATLLVTGIAATMAGADVLLAVGIGQLGLLVVPAIAMRLTHRGMRALGVGRPHLRFVVASVLVGVSAWYVNLRILELLAFPEGDLQGLQNLIERYSLVAVLVAIALAPAICEEVLFRGVLARGFATRFRPWVAIVLSAAMFSIYHLKPIQMIPTFTLGLVFGLIALRAGSALPTMLAHLLNNTMALLVARSGDSAVPRWLERNPTFALVIAAVLTGGGVVLVLVRAPSEPLPRDRRAIPDARRRNYPDR